MGERTKRYERVMAEDVQVGDRMARARTHAFIPASGRVYQAARDRAVQLPLARRALASMIADLRARLGSSPEAARAIERTPSLVEARARVARWSSRPAEASQ